MTDADVASDLARRVPALAAEWSSSAKDLDLPYVALGHLARLVVVVSETTGASKLRPVFDEIEVRLATGDAATRNLLIVGFLEGLQNIEGDRAGRWERLLGKATKAAWTNLNALWTGRMTPADFNRFVDGSGDIPAR